jgi:hypothetical protein
MYVPRILIFFSIWENYGLLNLIIFGNWEYIFHIGYIIYPACSSLILFLIKSLLFSWTFAWISKMCMCQRLWFSLIFGKITGCWTWSFLQNESTYSIYRVHHLSGYLSPPTIFKCRPSCFTEYWYWYWRYACAKDFDFLLFFRKLQILFNLDAIAYSI